MNIQIMGLKKCSNTRKAERFFKERGVSFHTKDLAVKPLSKGEAEKILAKIDPEDLLDTESKTYQKKGFAYMEFDPVEEILEDNSLIKTPIVRNGALVTIGYDPDTWKKWLAE